MGRWKRGGSRRHIRSHQNLSSRTGTPDDTPTPTSGDYNGNSGDESSQSSELASPPGTPTAAEVNDKGLQLPLDVHPSSSPPPPPSPPTGETMEDDSSISSASGNKEGDTTTTLSPSSPQREKKVHFSCASRNFNMVDKERIRAYLREYRDGAERVLGNKRKESDDPYRDYDAGVRRDDDGGPDCDETVWIAGHEFSSLTVSVLNHPYLFLPRTLGGRQRRNIHEICLDLGLYHGSCGEKPPLKQKSQHTSTSTRQLVISIHPSGLRRAPGLSPPHITHIRKCRPWYYKTDPPLTPDKCETPIKDNRFTYHPSSPSKNCIFTPSPTVTSKTKQAHQTIQSLITDPTRCLRDAHDILDFAELSPLSLSTAAIPSPNDYEGIGNHTEDTNFDPYSHCPYLLVDTPRKMHLCTLEITSSHPSELAFDLEMHNPSKYEGITCLLQLSTECKSYVIDPFAEGVWDTIGPSLGPLFENTSIVKIGHCIGGMDVPSLHRDFGIVVCNAFDTHEAAKVLKLPRVGLAKICEYYALKDDGEYSKLKAAYQSIDWRKRPLTQDMLRYARYDVRYMMLLRKLMMRDLTRAQFWDSFDFGAKEEEKRLVARTLAASMSDSKLRGSDGGSVASSSASDEGYFTPTEDDSGSLDGGGGRKKAVYNAKELRHHATLMKVITVSQKMCLRLWGHKKEHAMKCDALKSLMRREGPRWSIRQTRLYEQLFAWRNRVAMEEETMSGMICPTPFLVSVAYVCPRKKDDLKKISFFLPELIEEEETGYADQILEIVEKCLGKDETCDVVVESKMKKEESKKEEVSLIKPQTEEVKHMDKHVMRALALPSDKLVEKKKSNKRLYFRIGAFCALGGITMFLVFRRKRK